MDSSGARLLAKTGGFSSLYDEAQLALLEQRRLIPLEAFGYALRAGPLRQSLENNAPWLLTPAQASAGPPPEAPATRPQGRLYALVLGLSLIAGVALAVAPADLQDVVLAGVGGVALLLASLQTALSSVRAWRTEAPLLALLFGLLALLLLALAVVS
jgi:hypothetical protein